MEYLGIQEKLRVPFDVAEVEFRPAEQNGDVLAYVNDKNYADRLHEAAPGLWHMEDLQVRGEGKATVVSLAIVVAGVKMYGISDPKQPTSAYAQAFKRACVNHGLGAYLYRFPKIWGNQVRYNDTGRAIKTNSLSIAIWCYDKLGMEVPEAAREALNGVNEADLFNPTAKRQERPRQDYPPREERRDYQRPVERDAVAGGGGGDNDPSIHKGKVSEKQCAVLYKAGLTDADILAMDTQDARDAVSEAIKGAKAEQLRSMYLGAAPAAPAGGAKRKSW